MGAVCLPSGGCLSALGISSADVVYSAGGFGYATHSVTMLPELQGGLGSQNYGITWLLGCVMGLAP